MRPDQKFTWRHFGKGPVRKSLQEELKLFPQNAEGYLDGYVPIEQIMNYYRENPVDLIVNVSEFEGAFRYQQWKLLVVEFLRLRLQLAETEK